MRDFVRLGRDTVTFDVFIVTLENTFVTFGENVFRCGVTVVNIVSLMIFCAKLTLTGKAVVTASDAVVTAGAALVTNDAAVVTADAKVGITFVSVVTYFKSTITGVRVVIFCKFVVKIGAMVVITGATVLEGSAAVVSSVAELFEVLVVFKRVDTVCAADILIGTVLVAPSKLDVVVVMW